jgi:tRNA (guanine-N7-)-methyltransferase
MAAEDYIITRKRKKYKFARFEAMANCYESEEFSDSVCNNFANNSQIVVELGAGTGEFLVEQARLAPQQRFIAIDVKADRLYTGAKLAIEQGIDNVVFVRAHAAQLSELFKEPRVAELWLTFSDPFPKKRHIKHRMSHERFLQVYRKILQKDGILHFKTDNHDLFTWSLEQFVTCGLYFHHLSFDLHASDLPDRYKIMTAYEKRYTTSGLAIYYTQVSFDPVLSAPMSQSSQLP